MMKRKARILIIDDEKAIVRALQRSLAAHGYDVFTASSGEKALEGIELQRPDLLLLDLGLPQMSGLEVCKRVRIQSPSLPIIVISVNGLEVKLTPTEYDLLKIFLQHRGKIMTQQMLLTQMWGIGDGKDPHHLHVFIGQLRRKIEPDPLRPCLLMTIPGVGYRFNADDQ
jgi:two-component system KDP operon response regulator KdpE